MRLTHVVGVDIGSSMIRCAVARVEEDGVGVVGWGENPASGIRRGTIVDIDEAVSSISQALERAERMTGMKIDRAVVSVNGAHASATESHGVIAVARADGEITEKDIERVIDASQAIAIPPNREILHVIPRTFTVDGQTGIRDPLRMTAIRLEVDTHIVMVASPFMRNLTRCMLQAGIEVEDFVLAPLASARACLSKRQKELGVVVVELGGGTTGLAVFEEGDLLLSNVIGLGGSHITNDLAIGLRTSVDTAERLKLQYGTTLPKSVKRDEIIDLSDFSSEDEGEVSRHHVAEIIEARCEEIFDAVNKELRTIDRDGQLPAGAILVGGGAHIPGVVELAKRTLRLPAQIGYPQGLTSVIERVSDPTACCVVGLCQWAADYGEPRETSVIDVFSRIGELAALKRIRRLFRSFLP